MARKGNHLTVEISIRGLFAFRVPLRLTLVSAAVSGAIGLALAGHGDLLTWLIR